MQQISAFFLSMYVLFSGFFAGLPNAVLVWDKPTQTITSTAKVLELYKGIAAKNNETEFRERLTAGDLVDGRNDFLARVANAWAQTAMYLINPRIAEVVKGVPGTPKSLAASDIKSAKAEYYHDGKTLVIDIALKDQKDVLNGKSSNSSVTRGVGNMSKMEFNSVKVQVARLGYTLKSATLTYTNARIMIRVDTATQKIVKAEYTYHATVSAIRNEIDTPFKQSFDYELKKP